MYIITLFTNITYVNNYNNITSLYNINIVLSAMSREKIKHV